MGSTYQLLLNGQAADPDLYTAVSSLEVEESLDLPGAVQLSVPLARTAAGDLTYVSDSRFQPLANLAVVVTPAAGSAAGSPVRALGAAASALGVGGSGSPGAQCIFDGYILSHKLHLETGTTNSTLSVWGQDASWLMNLKENVKEWVDVTDADVANAIFGDYGITPVERQPADDSPSHTESGHSLMQRGSDIQFLRTLARRNGKVCRVACADTPGQPHRLLRQAEARRHPGGRPVAQRHPGVDGQRARPDWDATLADGGHRPAGAVHRQRRGRRVGRHVRLRPDRRSASRGLAAFTGKPMTVCVERPGGRWRRADAAGALAAARVGLVRALRG